MYQKQGVTCCCVAQPTPTPTHLYRDGACQLVDWLCNIHSGREECRLLDSRIITDVGSMRQALANADQILQSHDDTVRLRFPGWC